MATYHIVQWFSLWLFYESEMLFFQSFKTSILSLLGLDRLTNTTLECLKTVFLSNVNLEFHKKLKKKNMEI